MEASLALPEEDVLFDLADFYKMFGDTTRIKILYALMDGPLCVADIAAACAITQSAASHQLRKLKHARLVRFKREGKNILYSLCDSHVLTILEQGLSHIGEEGFSGEDSLYAHLN